MTSPDVQIRKLAARLIDMERKVATLQQSNRSPQLAYSSIHDSSVKVWDGGEVRARIGRQSDGRTAVTYFGGDPPPQPSAAKVSARQLALVIGWDGTFADGSSTPSNLQRVDVHLSEVAGFTPSADTAWVSLLGRGAVSIAGDMDPKYVKLVAVTNSQVASTPSTEVSATPLGVDQLATDLLLTSRLYMQDANGNITLDLQGSTGSAMVAGEYRTAKTGERIVMNSGLTDSKTIRFYPPTSTSDSDTRAEIYRVGDQIVVTSEDDANGVSCHFYASPTEGTIGRGQLGSPPRSRVQVSGDTASVDAGAVYLVADKRYGTGKTSMFIYDVNGNAIDTATLRHQTGFSDWASFYNNTNNIGIVFGRRSADAAMYCTYADGSTHADLQVRAVFQSSSRDAKTRIEGIPFDAVSVVRAAPSKMWERPDPPQAESEIVPSEPEIGSEGELVPQPPTWQPAPPPMSSAGVKHFGPMAEDLPPEMVVNDDMSGALVVDLGSQIGVLWKAVEELATRLDSLESRTPTALR